MLAFLLQFPFSVGSVLEHQSGTEFNVSGWAVPWVVVFLGQFPRYRR